MLGCCRYYIRGCPLSGIYPKRYGGGLQQEDQDQPIDKAGDVRQEGNDMKRAVRLL